MKISIEDETSRRLPTIEKVSEFNKVRAILTRPAAFLRRQISDYCPCIHQRHNHI